MRSGDTYAQLAAGFGIATVYRCIRLRKSRPFVLRPWPMRWRRA
ncbi:hypothetical protein [Streptomyces globisporus]